MSPKVTKTLLTDFIYSTLLYDETDPLNYPNAGRFKKENSQWVEDSKRTVLQCVAESGQSSSVLQCVAESGQSSSILQCVAESGQSSSILKIFQPLVRERSQ